LSEAPSDKKDAHDEGERRPISYLAAAAWTISLMLLGAVVLQITEHLRPGADEDLVNYTACHVLVHSLVLFAMLRVYAPSSPVRSALGLRAVSPLHVLLAAVIGAAMHPAITALDALVQKKFPPPPEELEAIAKLLSTSPHGARAVIAVVLVLVLPVTIELFFRGMLYGGVRRGRASGTAMLATTVYFMSSQEPREMLGAFVLGLVLVWLRAQSGSVLSPLAAHVAFAVVPVVPILRGADPMSDVAYPLQWTAGGLGLALVALLLARAIAQRDPRAIAALADDE
jgi:membrane protease YdiL (CAAX protease family)